MQPTPALRELLLLQSLASDPMQTQSGLAAKIGVAPAMVNVYLARLCARRLVSKHLIGRKGMYRVTDAGRKQLDYHAITYLAELSDLAAQTEIHFRDFFESISHTGSTSIVLYGAGETARVLASAARDSTVRLVGVFDDDITKQHTTVAGVEVLEPTSIRMVRPDAIVVATWRYTDEILERIHTLEIAEIPVWTLAGRPVSNGIDS